MAEGEEDRMTGTRTGKVVTRGRIGVMLRHAAQIGTLLGVALIALVSSLPTSATERFDYDDVRVEAFVRDSLVDMGLVAQFKNFSGQTLERCF